MTEDLDLRLATTGAELQRAWRADLRRRHGVKRRRIVLVLVAGLLVVAAGVAAADSLLKSPREQQLSMLAGATLFTGSNPVCTATSATSYRCTLEAKPTGETFLGPDGKPTTNGFLGMKDETVDESHHVDGGCISRAADGRTWDCYVGQEAVDLGIIGQSLLGSYQSGPAAA